MRLTIGPYRGGHDAARLRDAAGRRAGHLLRDAGRPVGAAGPPPCGGGPWLAQHTDGARTRGPRRPGGARGARRTQRRLHRTGHRAGHGHPCGVVVHQWYGGDALPCSRGRGRSLGRADVGAHRRPATRAAGHRCAADHRSDRTVRRCRPSLRRPRGAGGRRRRWVARPGRRLVAQCRGCRPRPGARQPAVPRAVGGCCGRAAATHPHAGL